MLEQFQEIEHKFNDLERRMSDPEIISDQKKYQDILKEHSNLTVGVELFRELKKTLAELDDLASMVDDPEIAIQTVFNDYSKDALSLDKTDGVSLSFKNWRFNLRRSNTEPLVRLNVEGKGDPNMLKGYIREIITKLQQNNS